MTSVVFYMIRINWHLVYLKCPYLALVWAGYNPNQIFTLFLASICHSIHMLTILNVMLQLQRITSVMWLEEAWRDMLLKLKYGWPITCWSCRMTKRDTCTRNLGSIFLSKNVHAALCELFRVFVTISWETLFAYTLIHICKHIDINDCKNNIRALVT